MTNWARVGLVATLTLTTVPGCDENESPSPTNEMQGPGHIPAAWSDAGSQELPHGDAAVPVDIDDDWQDDFGDDDWNDEWDNDFDDDRSDADAGRDGGQLGEVLGHDAGTTPRAPQPPPGAPVQDESPRTAVPGELVGAWEHGTIDFQFWENYKPETWAGKHAIPMREAMIFRSDGTAKFYRYEALFNFYEEMIDCEGTVTFDDDGTFTFHPQRGRKRFYDTSQRMLKTDRALNAEELVSPKIAGTRGYRYLPTNEPPAIEIRVPSSAPYKWYKKQE